MAESSLSVTINDLRREVAVFLGWPRTIANWSTTHLNDFDFISERALRTFYFPPISVEVPRYEWSFLRKTGTITLQTNVSSYTLPDDFSGTILDESSSWPASQNEVIPLKISESNLRKLQSNDSQTQGIPKYFSVRNKAHDAVNGQRWEFLCYPTPSAAENNIAISYRYVFIPDVLSNTNQYPVGGGQYSEVITVAHLASAELLMDKDPSGPYHQKFVELLHQSVRSDEQQKANARGGEE